MAFLEQNGDKNYRILSQSAFIVERGLSLEGPEDETIEQKIARSKEIARQFNEYLREMDRLGAFAIKGASSDTKEEKRNNTQEILF